MATYTLLDYVQTILSSMDSDEVASISATVESLQVANVVKTVYNDIVSRTDLPEYNTLFELNASTDALKPVLMTRPEDVLHIEWIQYDCILDGDTTPNYVMIPFCPLAQFLQRVNSLDTDESNVGTMSLTIASDTITFPYRNDKAPEFYTTFDDHQIVFDSYDSAVDTTLQKEKTRCFGKKDQSFQMVDTFIPFIDRDLSTLLLNESKVLAFAELKQMGHDIAKQWARRGWIKSQKSREGIKTLTDFDKLPNFGRIPRGYP